MIGVLKYQSVQLCVCVRERERESVLCLNYTWAFLVRSINHIFTAGCPGNYYLSSARPGPCTPPASAVLAAVFYCSLLKNAGM